MTKARARGEDVRSYILNNVERHPSDIARVTASQFDITRQAVNKHLQRLIAEKALSRSGSTRSSIYLLTTLENWDRQYQIVHGLAEDIVWRDDVRPHLEHLPGNVLSLWHHGFTEMFNNAIDHSEGTTVTVMIERTASSTEMIISDDGVGIFRKIQREMGLLDERHAILELSKGKLTTDPKRHSGEGIFFTSRMFDSFDIMSGGVFFSHEVGESDDWALEQDHQNGTAIFMRLSNHTARTTRKVFDQYASGEDLGFDRTVVPVTLARYGNDQLISRSQAKRLLVRVNQFRNVVFDYRGVETIGQAFADEVYRVFANEHPEIAMTNIHVTPEVERMIARVKQRLKEG